MPESSGATVLDDLPDCIIFEEILVRLPTEDLLRCRAVSKSWHGGTSNREFILAHHRRQPSFPIIYFHQFDYHLDVFCGTGTRRILQFTRRNGRRRTSLDLQATCDGLLLVSGTTYGHGHGDINSKTAYHVCNPASRESAPVPQLPSCARTSIAGFYWHQTSREYRVLYWTLGLGDNDNDDFYALTLGSGEQRCIGPPPLPLFASPVRSALPGSSYNAPVLHRGCLHWYLGLCSSHTINNILVFDTTAETFRLMSCPSLLGPWRGLLEMGGMLSICSTADGVHIDVFVLQDYEAEVWVFKRRIDLSAVASPLPSEELFPRIAMINERELLIQLDDHLLHCDIDGKLLGNIDEDNTIVWVTCHFLQVSIIPLPFSKTQEEDGVNKKRMFILGM